MTAALLFDLDGTLADTDPEHYKAFVEVFADHGIPLTQQDYDARIMGHPGHAIAREFFPNLPLDESMAVMLRKEALYRDMLSDITPIAGAIELLDFADRKGIPYVLVTNAPEANAVAVLDAIGIRRRFKTLISAFHMAEAKPHPRPYLMGLETLGASATRSVAFEDSRSGARAAVAAGLALVGMTTTLDAGVLLDLGADIAVKDYTDPAVRDLIERRAHAKAG